MPIGRYQAQGGIIGRVGGVDTSHAFRARAQAATAIGRVAIGVQDAAYGIAARSAELAGEQAGVRDAVQFDQNGNLKPLTRLPDDISIYSQAYRQAAITNYVSAAATDARNQADEMGRKFASDPESFRTNWNAYVEKTLGELEDSVRPYVASDMHRVGAAKFGALADAKAQIDMENAVAGLDGQVQRLYGEVYARIREIGADAPRTIAEIQAAKPQFDALLQQYKVITNGRVGDADIAEQWRKVQVGIFEAMVSNEAVRAVSRTRTIDGLAVPDTDGALAYLEELRRNKPGYAEPASPEEWDGIINRAKADVQATVAARQQAIDQQRVSLNIANMRSRLEFGIAMQEAIVNNDAATLAELERRVLRGEGLAGSPTDVMQAQLALGPQILASRAQVLAESEQADLVRQEGELQRELDLAVNSGNVKAQREVQAKIMALKGRYVSPVQLESTRQQLLSRLQAAQIEVRERMAEQQQVLSFAAEKIGAGLPLERQEADALVSSALGLGKRFARGERAAMDMDWLNPTTPEFAGRGIDFINQMQQVPTPHLEAFQSILGGAMTPTAFQQGSPDPQQIVSTAQNFITLDTGANATVQQQLRALPGYAEMRDFANIVTQEIALQPQQDHARLIAQARGVVSKNKANRISRFSEAYKADTGATLNLARSALQFSIDQGNIWSQVGRSIRNFGGGVGDMADNVGAAIGKILPGGLVDLSKDLGLDIFVDEPANTELDEEALGNVSGDFGRNLQSIIPGWTPEADDIDFMSLSSEELAIIDGYIKGAAIEVGASGEDVINPSPAFQQAIAKRLGRVFGVSSVGNPDHAERMTFLAPERITGMSSGDLIAAIKGDLPRFKGVAAKLGIEDKELDAWVNGGNVWIEVDAGAWRRNQTMFRLMARDSQGYQMDLTAPLRAAGLAWDPRLTPVADRVRRRDYWAQRAGVEDARRMGLPAESQETMGKGNRAFNAVIDWLTPEMFRNDPPPVPSNAR